MRMVGVIHAEGRLVSCSQTITECPDSSAMACAYRIASCLSLTWLPFTSNNCASLPITASGLSHCPDALDTCTRMATHVHANSLKIHRGFASEFQESDLKCPRMHIDVHILMRGFAGWLNGVGSVA
jgi:hypothetical protein